MSNTELKPCPFCGGEAIVYTSRDELFDFIIAEVRCKKCTRVILRGTTVYDVEGAKRSGCYTPEWIAEAYCGATESAIEAWNKRTVQECVK